MRLATVLTIMAIPLLAVACIPGVSIVAASGHSVTRTIDVADFTRVAASSAFEVEINQGETYSVEISADERIMEYIQAEKVGDTLRVGFQPGFGTHSMNVSSLRATITMPVLEGVRLSGASRGELSGFSTGDDMDVALSGSSTLSGDVQANTLRVEAGGASRLELSGAAQRLIVDCSGSSRMELQDLRVDQADVELSGASRAQIDVSSELDYDLSGASRLEYVGDPEIGFSDTSGGSSVRAG